MAYDRDRILQAVDLPALADELLGPHKGNGRTPTWSCPDEHHAQTGRTPPVTVFTTRWGEQRWTCHGCGASGTAIDLVMLTQNVDVKAALGLLAERVGVPGDGGPSRWTVPPRRQRPAPREEPSPDPRIEDYVAACVRELWAPSGAGGRDWLIERRGLSPAVLRANRVGFDPSPSRLDRPQGIPRARGVVLPVIGPDGRAIYTQTRRLAQDAEPRYLNCSGAVAPNPRLAVYRGEPTTGKCVVVCEGALDALSVAVAGRRSAAVLGAGLADARVAALLRDLDAPIIVGFDADPAGDAGAHRLKELLARHGHPVLRLRPPTHAGDINAWMTSSRDWPETLSTALRSCFRARQQAVAVGRAG